MARLLRPATSWSRTTSLRALRDPPAPAPRLAAGLDPLGPLDPLDFGIPGPNVLGRSPRSTKQDLLGAANPAGPAPRSTTQCDARARSRGPSPTRGAVVVSGDATGLDNLAGLGLLDTDSAIYYAGTLDGDQARLQQLVNQGAQLVVTDTNRKQAFRWDTLTANTGLHRDAEREPGQDRPERQPDRPVPRRAASAPKTYGELHRSGQRHRQQLRQPGLLHARGPGLQRHRQQPRHGVGHRHLRTRPGRASGGRSSSPTRSPSTTSRSSSPSTATGRAGSPRWPSPSTADPVTYASAASHADRPARSSPSRPGRFHTLRLTIDPHHRRHGAAAHGASAVGFAEVGIPGAVGDRGHRDADRPVRERGRRLARRPAHPRHGPLSASRRSRPAATPRPRSPASSRCPRRARSRCRAWPASRPSCPTTRSTRWWVGPTPRARHHRLLIGPAARATLQATASATLDDNPPRPGSPASARPPRCGSS